MVAGLPSWGTFAAVYAAMGVAVLVRGPIGALLPTCVLGMFLLWRSPSVHRGSWAERTRETLVAFLHPWHWLRTE